MRKNYTTILAIAIITFSVAYNGVTAIKKKHGSNGELSVSGSPGESTCSKSGCHGSVSADNTGGGSISISTIPAFVNNTYIPGQNYKVKVTVSQQGCSKFGFDFEALDASKLSGSYSVFTNNSIGMFSVDPSDSKVDISQFRPGKGNWNAFHSSPATTLNSGEFVFLWQAPATGTVNLYATGNAANGNNQPDSGDKIYKTSILNLTPGSSTSIENEILQKSVKVYPNPVTDILNIELSLSSSEEVVFSFVNTNGTTSKVATRSMNEGDSFTKIDVSDLKKGSYLLFIKTPKAEAISKIIKK